MTDPGTIIDDRYQVVRQLGEGGMGAVYVAIEIELNRQVALKLLHPGFLADEEQRARFEREGRILSSLSHPNILTFFRFGTWRRTTPYIVMEYLDGVSLRDLIDEGSLSLSRCLDIALQMAQALQYAHNHNIVHRDIKPTNVLELHDADRTIKILDFGLARVVAGDSPQHLTQTGDLIGSVFYMSPEQCTGKKADSRSDIYSLGCVLYEMCTGDAPFKADNPIGLMHKHATEDVPPVLARKELAADEVLLNSLNGIIRKCMEKAPQNRYQEMDELAADLRLLKQGKVDELKMQAPTPSRKRQTKILLLASVMLMPVVLLPFVFHANSIDTKPVLQKREPRQQKPLGLQAQLSAILNQPRGHKRYLELKQIAELLESHAAENTVDTRPLYITLCSEAEATSDSDYIIPKLERFLKQRMKTNPQGAFTATMWDFLARNYAQQGYSEQAEAAARTALRILDEEPEVDTRRETYPLYILYHCMRFKQRKIQDRSRLVKAVKLALRTDLGAAVSRLSPELAYYYLLEGNRAEEEKLFDASLRSLAKAPYSDQLAYLQNLTSVFYQLGKSDVCTKRIPAWLNIVASTPEIYATSRFQVGESLVDQSPLQALAYFNDVAPRLSLPKDKHLLACLTATRARALLRLDRYEEATKATNEALELSAPTTAGYTMALAIVCAQKDQLDLLDRCLDQFDKAANTTFVRPQELVNHYRQLCEELSPAYHGERKLKYMQRCKSLALQLSKPCNPGLMHLLEIGIAQAYDKLGQHQKALDMVLKLLPEIKNDQLDCRIKALEIGISSALYVDKVDTANTFLAEALHLIRLNPGEVYGANRMNDLAMCYADTNHPEKSEQIFIASCNDRKAYGTLYDDAAIMLAQFYNGTDQPHKTLSLLKKLDRPSNAILIQRSDTLRWSQFEIETGVAYRLLNHPGEALKHFRNAAELAGKVDFCPDIIIARANEATELIALQRALRKPDATIEQLLQKMRQDANSNRRGLAEVVSYLEAQYLLNCNQRKEAANALLRTIDACKKHPSYESPRILLSTATRLEILGLRSEAVACRDLAADYIRRIHGDSYTKVRVLRSAEENDKRLRSQLRTGAPEISRRAAASPP